MTRNDLRLKFNIDENLPVLVANRHGDINYADDYTHWLEDIALTQVNGVEKSDEPALNLPVVINSGLPEWLNEDTKRKALTLWNKHTTNMDNYRVKAVKVIQSRAEDAGYTITMRKGMELFKSHCL